jgi:predicted amidohydrolase
MPLPDPLRVAFLQLSDAPGDIDAHRRRIWQGTLAAAEAEADWVLTPELAVSGYGFAPEIGTDWIGGDRTWQLSYCRLVGRLGLTAFLGAPVRDGERLHNAVLVIAEGRIVGRQDKVAVLPGEVEGWAAPGEPRVIAVDGVRVGVLVCADAWRKPVVADLCAQGAEILVSAAHWTPGFHGPEGIWEARSAESGLPLLVCNCTGADTVVAIGGRRWISERSARDTLIVVDVTQWGCELAYSPKMLTQS